MQYVITTFWQVIFSDSSTSSFKFWTYNSFMIACFRGNFNVFLKIFDVQTLERCKIVLGYRFRQNENVKLLWYDFFCFAPSKNYLNKFCKAFQQNVLHQVKFILWFFELKTVTCKDDGYLQKENLFIKEIPKNHVLLLLKNPVTLEWFLSPIPHFCDKRKGETD